MPKPKISIRKPTLQEVIEKVTGKKTPLRDLDYSERLDILRQIESDKLKIKAIDAKWYDVLDSRFHVLEYRLDEYQCKESETNFDDFDSFFKYVEGDIYSSTCFYGYKFTPEQIQHYGIKENQINFRSFITKTIDDDLIQSPADLQKGTIAPAIKKWVDSRPLPTCRKEYEKVNKLFKDKFGRLVRFEDWIFLSMMIEKDAEVLKPVLMEIASEHQLYCPITLEFIMLTYGADAARFVLEKYHGNFTKDTINRRKRAFRKTLDQYENGSLRIIRNSSYDAQLGLYYVDERIDNGRTLLPLTARNYFSNFDAFVNFLHGDLRNANLGMSPIPMETILKFETDSRTTLPPDDKGTNRTHKQYDGRLFKAEMELLNDEGKTIWASEFKSRFFFDFIHYLKGDLSGSDFSKLDRWDRIKDIPGINIDDLKISEEFPIRQSSFEWSPYEIANKEQIERNESQTSQCLALSRESGGRFFERTRGIGYISDIHLENRLHLRNCTTIGQMKDECRKIANELADQAKDFNLFAGDIAHDVGIYQTFINQLGTGIAWKNCFFTLGNHELWAFPEKTINEITDIYRQMLRKANPSHFHLVQNSLFYLKRSGDGPTWNEISESELGSISPNELRDRTKQSRLIIFGGIGFTDAQSDFNANNMVYGKTLTRYQELAENAKFQTLYQKVVETLGDRALIIMTHMPIHEWGSDVKPVNGVVYLYGHNHENDFEDDGSVRIYHDNQIGYNGKEVKIKSLPFETGYDYFDDYGDGIYQISVKDYLEFYRGIGESIQCVDKGQTITMVKRNKTYMFFGRNWKNELCLMNGGAKRLIEQRPIEYYFDRLDNYCQSIKLFLHNYDECQVQLANEVKAIGGSGRIHGTIIDIDFFNHLSLDPLSGKIVPYFALSTCDVTTYPTIEKLLRENCGPQYKTYLANRNERNELILYKGAIIKPSEVDTDEMYRASRVMRSLQYATRHNVIRIWNDKLADRPSKDLGRQIVAGLIGNDKS